MNIIVYLLLLFGMVTSNGILPDNFTSEVSSVIMKDDAILDDFNSNVDDAQENSTSLNQLSENTGRDKVEQFPSKNFNNRKKYINIKKYNHSTRVIPKTIFDEMLMTQLLPFFLYETMKIPKIERKGGYINKIGKKPKTHKESMVSLGDQKFKQITMSSSNNKRSNDSKSLFKPILSFLSNMEHKRHKHPKRTFKPNVKETVIIILPDSLEKRNNSLKLQSGRHSVKKALNNAEFSLKMPQMITENNQLWNQTSESPGEKEITDFQQLNISFYHNFTSDTKPASKVNTSDHINRKNFLYSEIRRKRYPIYISLFFVILIILSFMISIRKKSYSDYKYNNSALRNYQRIDLAGFGYGYKNDDTDESLDDLKNSALKNFASKTKSVVKKSLQGSTYKRMNGENSNATTSLPSIHRFKLIKKTDRVPLLDRSNEVKSAMKSDPCNDFESDGNNESYMSILNDIADIIEMKSENKNVQESKMPPVAQLIDTNPNKNE